MAHSKTMLLVACLSVVFIFTGCWEEEPKAASSGSPKAKTKIVYWRHFFAPEDKAVKKLIQLFEDDNPDITVSYQSMPFKGYREKLSTSLRAGKGPHVINIHNSWAYGFIKSGFVLPIPKEVSSIQSLDKELIPLAASFRLNGKYYGIPIGGGCLALFINTAHARAAGLDISNPPSNWKELKAWALKMTVKDGNKIKRSGFACGGIKSQSWNYLVEALFRQNGCRIISDDNQSVLWNTPQGLEAFEWYLSFVRTHRIFDLSFGKPFEIFAREECSMIVEGNWILGKLKEIAPALSYTIVKLPAAKKKATYGSCWGNCVTSSARGAQKKAAFRFVKFITSEKSSRIWTEVVGELPLYKRILKDSAFLKKHTGLSPFIQSMPYAYSSLKKDETRYKESITEAVQEVILRKTPPAAALKQAADTINKMLSEK